MLGQANGMNRFSTRQPFTLPLHPVGSSPPGLAAPFFVPPFWRGIPSSRAFLSPGKRQGGGLVTRRPTARVRCVFA